MKRFGSAIALVIIAAVVMFYAPPAPSFAPEVTPQGTARDKWTGPISWVVNPAHGSNITGATSVGTVISDSFATWRNAPNTALPIGSIGGTTGSTAVGNDGVNVICFTCTPPGGFGKDGTIAITLTTTNNSTGQIVDADMVFNGAVSFLTDPVTPTGNVESLQTVATHEFGHFLGLDHTGVIRATMYPFAPALETTLSYDDVAGISTAYPGTPPSGLTYNTSTISGTVRNGANAAVFGAHVFAESITGAAPIPGPIRKSAISTLTRPDGTYVISGLPTDLYTVTAEPLDGPAQNENFDWGTEFGTPVATNFTTRQH
jgi:Matrixin